MSGPPLTAREFEVLVCIVPWDGRPDDDELEGDVLIPGKRSFKMEFEVGVVRRGQPLPDDDDPEDAVDGERDRGV